MKKASKLSSLKSFKDKGLNNKILIDYKGGAIAPSDGGEWVISWTEDDPSRRWRRVKSDLHRS